MSIIDRLGDRARSWSAPLDKATRRAGLDPATVARLIARAESLDYAALRRNERACVVARGRLSRRHSALTMWHAQLSDEALDRDVTDTTGRLCLAALCGDRDALDELASLPNHDPLAAAVLALFDALTLTTSPPESPNLTAAAPPPVPPVSPCAGHRSRRRRRPDRVSTRCLSAVVWACAPPAVSLVPTQASPDHSRT